MIAAEITSRKNPAVREFAELSASARARREKGLFPAEGARLCADAAESGISVRTLFETRDAAQKYGGYLETIRRSGPQELLISDSVAEYLSETKSPQGIFCICVVPEKPQSFPSVRPESRFLLLENVSDPANIGAVLRTAEALGVDGVLLCGDCCDVYSPKALRAGMGAAFRIPLYRFSSAPETLRRLKGMNCDSFAAVPDASAEKITSISFSDPAVIAVGNEGSGLSSETISSCVHRVTIPMLGRAESLNAAASAAILMWEMMRGAGKEAGLRDE